MRGSVSEYTAHMYSIQAHTSVRREHAQKEGTPRAAACLGCTFPAVPSSGRSRKRAAPWVAAAGPGAPAQGRQATPLRLALAPRPALAARGPLARWQRRWRRAVSAASGGPVSAARRCGGSCGHGCGAPGCPRRQPGCQPPGGAGAARGRGLTARCSLRSLAQVRQSAQHAADRSTRPVEPPRQQAGLPPLHAGLPATDWKQGVYPLHPRARASLTSRTTREKR